MGCQKAVTSYHIWHSIAQIFRDMILCHILKPKFGETWLCSLPEGTINERLFLRNAAIIKIMSQWQDHLILLFFFALRVYYGKIGHMLKPPCHRALS